MAGITEDARPCWTLEGLHRGLYRLRPSESKPHERYAFVEPDGEGGFKAIFTDRSERRVEPDYSATSGGICVKSLEDVGSCRAEVCMVQAEFNFLRECADKMRGS